VRRSSVRPLSPRARKLRLPRAARRSCRLTLPLRRWSRRNLCIDGGYDLCAEIYNKGILSPLAALIPQVRRTVFAA
jgi:hypothetical protein